MPDRTLYKAIQAGRFVGSPRLVWLRPDVFILENGDGAFKFIRHNDEEITPGRILTDGGSIPNAVQGLEGFSPWHYAPAFIIHDWIFDWHKDPRTHGPCPHTLETAADIMAEGMKTLMDDPASGCVKSATTLWLMHCAVTSFIAKRLWDSGPSEKPPR